MPVTPATSIPLFASNLVATGNIGAGVPKVAKGLGVGLSTWVATVQASALATGTLGVGAGLTPLIVPSPILYAALLAAAPGEKILGVLAPLFLLGVANGASLSLATGIVQTVHPTVGTGGGTVTFKAPPSAPFFEKALKAAGVQSPDKLARTVGKATDNVFRALVLPIAVVGPPSIAPSAGPGTGKIV
jgi:hypothetical protein